jgi:hypothetical protein
MLIPALLKCAGMLPWKAGGGEVQPKLRGTCPADAARLAPGWLALAEADVAKAASPRVAAQAAAAVTCPVLEMFIGLPSFAQRRHQG